MSTTTTRRGDHLFFIGEMMGEGGTSRMVDLRMAQDLRSKPRRGQRSVPKDMDARWFPGIGDWTSFTVEELRQVETLVDRLIKLDFDDPGKLQCTAVVRHDGTVCDDFPRKGEEELRYCRLWRRDEEARWAFHQLGALVMRTLSRETVGAQSGDCQYHSWTVMRLRTPGDWDKSADVELFVDERNGHSVSLAFVESTTHEEDGDHGRLVVVAAFTMSGGTQGATFQPVDVKEQWATFYRYFGKNDRGVEEELRRFGSRSWGTKTA
ncbi:uncharacterized protein B0I36DRAFT_316353 [Microdochium trichocladiopsis]|uniref:Uncharacterized protein n=1 Tax=Microdochium trichocladiopsis TaxID=1682393 RepID=A0A9P8YFV9_9PEZI|nr:uncharacterized protein B0I36DRAFT_316321 [Microdochium trichocladiopsis]XP_046017585.1 uncharacterized protein B0I36DRAFT_316353 [Microdochium trichocladiopsis]KAH7038458.1 hypothetical protein B0I36DRAFT_316321 [Microdochium trichocladiopsis]KAH7038464.1 hypothetical protein B0I36DRAFT_316353 [Microdochium trichocladiopsis]